VAIYGWGTMDPESFHGGLTVVDTHCDSLKCMLPEFTEARGGHKNLR